MFRGKVLDISEKNKICYACWFKGSVERVRLPGGGGMAFSGNAFITNLGTTQLPIKEERI
jgi:hypothetical protein